MKYTKRKKSLLKKQISDLNEKLRTDLQIITEKKLERFEGINAISQEKKKNVYHQEIRKPSCNEESLSLEKAAAGERELHGGGDLDVDNVLEISCQELCERLGKLENVELQYEKRKNVLQCDRPDGDEIKYLNVDYKLKSKVKSEKKELQKEQIDGICKEYEIENVQSDRLEMTILPFYSVIKRWQQKMKRV